MNFFEQLLLELLSEAIKAVETKLPVLLLHKNGIIVANSTDAITQGVTQAAFAQTVSSTPVSVASTPSPATITPIHDGAWEAYQQAQAQAAIDVPLKPVA